MSEAQGPNVLCFMQVTIHLPSELEDEEQDALMDQIFAEQNLFAIEEMIAAHLTKQIQRSLHVEVSEV